jgi:N-acetylglucosamine kinase-like BadF-type ATPase
VATYLGVDGGGTKTAFVLIDDHGRTLAETTGPGSYSVGTGTDLVARVLEAGVAAVERRSGVPRAEIDRAFFALPAYGESSAEVAELDAIPGRVLGHRRYSCGNDMVAGWAGSLGGEDGISVVAGTGSIAYGEWAGRRSRAGGWGEVFGDEGSGYWTAVEGLNVFARMADGRLPRGPLHAAMREAVGAATDLDVIGIVHGRWEGRRERVAALSRVVAAAADEGDPVAADVLEQAGVELATLAFAVREEIRVPIAVPVPVSYSGGMFWVPRVLDSFRRALGPGFALRRPLHGPAMGAALYARRAAG